MSRQHYAAHQGLPTWRAQQVRSEISVCWLADEAWDLFAAAARDESVDPAAWDALTVEYEHYYDECAAVAWSSIEAARGMPRRLRTQVSPALKEWLLLSTLEWTRQNYNRIPQSRR